MYIQWANDRHGVPVLCEVGLQHTTPAPHRKQLEQCKPLDSREMRERVEVEVERERRRWEEVAEGHRQRLDDQKKAYRDLEEEFRSALRIEAGRFQEVNA